MTEEEIVARMLDRQAEQRRQMFEQVAAASRVEREVSADLWIMLNGTAEERQEVTDRLLRRVEENREPPPEPPPAKPDA